MATHDRVSIALAVDSLMKKFRLVPFESVPAIIDCFLTSTGISPSVMFDSLMDSFSKFLKDLLEEEHSTQKYDSNHITALTSAICCVISRLDPFTDALRLFIWGGFLPLAKMMEPTDHESLNHISELFNRVVIEGHAWKLMEETLVPFLIRSIGLHVGMCQNGEQSIYQWSDQINLNDKVHDSFFNPSLPSFISSPLPLSTACHLLTSLLLAASKVCQAIRSQQHEKVDVYSSVENFVANLVWDLSDITFCIFSQSPINRSSAFNFLLPFIFKAFDGFHSFEVSVHGSVHIISRESLLRKIWKCCKSLFSVGTTERRDAFNVLSLYCSFLHSDVPTNFSGENSSGQINLVADMEFWKQIQKALVDSESLVRKQALQILKNVLRICFCSSIRQNTLAMQLHKTDTPPIPVIDIANSVHGMTKRQKWAEEEAKSLGVGKLYDLQDAYFDDQKRWEAFILLYEMLDEYGTHLVEAAWMHQVSLLLFSFPYAPDRYLSSGDCYQIQLGTLGGVFSWLAVLWERGFVHENPQVRCIIMLSFLDIDWAHHENWAKLVPENFVLGAFMQGLNDAIHHKDFGIRGYYSSKTIEGTANFFSAFSDQFSKRERLSFLCRLASVAKHESFGRPGLMALAFCISSSACRITSVSASEELVSEKSSCGMLENSPDDSKNIQTELLDLLKFILESSKAHFNPKYRLQVCEQVLDSAVAVVSASDIPFDGLLQFFSALPREFTDCSGPLRRKVQQWFSSTDDLCGNSNSVGVTSLVMKNLCDFPEKFIMQHHTFEDFISYNDEDLQSWGNEAQRWARVLLVAVAQEKHLEPLFMFFRNSAITLNKQQDCVLGYVGMKYLVLVLGLVQELEYARDKLTSVTQIKIEKGNYFMSPLDSESSYFSSDPFEKFSLIFYSFLNELVSFAKEACLIFWSSFILEDRSLPPSVRGKLGGPSQRRLSSRECTAVLQAIFSMKTISSISTWCIKIGNGASINSTFNFMWEFSLKVISFVSANQEIEAEIRLASYEALVAVVKALSTSFPSLAYDMISDYNKSSSCGQSKALLDCLLLDFLKNINEFLESGVLIRTRRAVLMNFKWFCLESLLSISCGLSEGSHDESKLPIFSYSTLRHVLVDLVESLENAGEESVLPMLRSVRVVLDLLFSERKISVASSANCLDSQLLMQFVRSAWILHVSCNKRRIAPISALLSSVLHFSLFGELKMHETIKNAQGPLKWFITKILDEGVKSPRTIRLAALHLTGMWLLYPRTIKYYMKELKQLALYGSVAFDEDFKAELVDNIDAKMEVSLLAQSPDSELTELFINTEMYARVSVSVLFYKLADLKDMLRAGTRNDDAMTAMLCGKMFLLELLCSVVKEADLAKELYKKYSAIHRRKVRAWQILCILSRFVEEDIVEEVTAKLHICLYRNNLPAVRQYIEIFAIQVYLKFPSLVLLQLIPIFHDYNMRPQALSSYVFIAANLILHVTPVHLQLRYLNELLPPIVPFLTSHHHSLRSFTQSLVYEVICKLTPLLHPRDSENMHLEQRSFDELKAYLAGNSDCAKLRASMEGILGAFDPNISATPAGIFTSQDEFECVPVSLMEKVVTFLNDVREDLRCYMANDEMIIKNESLRKEGLVEDRETLFKYNDDSMLLQTSKYLTLDFQKKITLHKHEQLIVENGYSARRSDFHKMFAEMEKEDQLLCQAVSSRNMALERVKDSQQNIIIVASLLDRIPNLAGLARTCEVFKASGLVIADAGVLQDKQFQLISVTAEKWIPIIEVPVCSLKVFLERKKQVGFSVLGLEQTANSTTLDKYSFPEKTVLVLGKEKEGIPVDIIHVLDACIEIPQLGVIRSLNVHVSGAIALWEYTRQQRCRHP